MLTTLYPEAGEATICLVVPREEGPVVPPEPDHDGARARQAWERANRRARSRSRRYIVANRLRFMWVLTSAGEGWHGPMGRIECMAAVSGFVRRLRATYGEQPYWFSPELHPGGHGWHCNVFLPRFLPHADIERLWSHGYVWAKDWTKDDRVKGESFLVKLRAGASYGAKYAAKDWGVEQLAQGAHRYERAEGYDPTAILAEVRTVADGVALALDHLGAGIYVWRSCESPDWDGPPCAVVFTRQGREPPVRPHVRHSLG